MTYLDLDDLLHVARRTLETVEVRDVGLLASAADRPLASAFGMDTYPTVHHKAAALLHSITRNHPLVDGNKRLGLAALLAFLGVNGPTADARQRQGLRPRHGGGDGELDDVDAIAERLVAATEARG